MHVVGCLYYCINDARSHKYQMNNNVFALTKLRCFVFIYLYFLFIILNRRSSVIYWLGYGLGLLKKRRWVSSGSKLALRTTRWVEEWKTNLMSLAVLFQFLCAQHVSDINISIFRSLRLCCWITTLVVLFSVRCVLEIWCSWFWVVFVLQAEACKTKHVEHIRIEIKQQVTSSWCFILQLLQWCTVQ